MLRAALFDLDGVLRQYDPAHPAAIEAQHDLPAGTLARIAFTPARLDPAVDGRATFEQWRDAIADVLTHEHGVDDGRGVTDRFFDVEAAAAVDAEVLAIVRGLRAGGLRVGLLTNATSRLDHELEVLRLTDEVDVVCNSSELGVAKPDLRAFELAVARMEVAPADCFFTDDRVENVDAARRAGLVAHHFTSATALAAALEP